MAEPAFPWPSPTPETPLDTITGSAHPSRPLAEMMFAAVGGADGRPQSTIESIFQDSQGYLWFATHQGANRFDGYEFVNYHHEPQDPSSLRADVIYAVAEDRAGGLWFGTQSGLDRLDRQSGSIAHIDLGTAEESAGRSVVVTSLVTDDEGNLWAGTHAGIFRLSLQGGDPVDIAHYNSLAVEGGLVRGLLVASLYQDSDGVLWAGTQHGLARYSAALDTFGRVPATSYTSSSAITRPARQAEYAAAGLYAPFVDTPIIIQAIDEVKPGLLLLGGEGLTLYNTRANSAFPLDLAAFTDAPPDLQSDRTWAVLRDASGIIWVGVDAGLARFDPATYEGRFIHFAGDAQNRAPLVLSLLQDAEGNLWLGTPDRGAFVHQPARQKFASPEPNLEAALTNATVWSIAKDLRGAVWIGTDTGVLRFDRTSGQVRELPLVTAPQGGVYPQSVRAIVEDLSGNIWAGTANGKLFLHNAGSDSFLQQYAGRLGTGYPINAMHVDRDGDLWIATNNGLYWHRPDRGTLQYLVHDPTRSDSLCHNRVLTVQEDPLGRIWLGTWNGVCSFDKQTGVFSRPTLAAAKDPSALEGPVFAIRPEGTRGLWFAGQSGEIRFLDLTTGASRAFSDPAGATVGLVYSLVSDEQGRFWFGTQHGLSSFDPETGVFATYSTQDGLPVTDFNMGAYARGPDGELFFGGPSGLVSFSPGGIPRNDYLPPVVVTELSQSGAPLGAAGHAADSGSLTLAWPNNYFEFEFAALSFARPEENQYAYYLQGVDSDWVLAGKNRRGRYVNLPGGDYVLHLSGSNNDGLWNSSGAQIHITVVPPLWQRRWFQAVAAFLILAIAFLGYRYRVHSIVQRSRHLESLVQDRTAQLTGINQELRQVVAQRKEAEQGLAQRIAAEAITTERNRLARDLHDAVTQTIFSASILSETLPHSLESNPTKARQQIAELHRLTQGALAELRSLLIELRPEGLVRTDLADLLGQLCRGVGGRSGIPVELLCDLQVEVPSEIKVTFYRIAQEALSNASRHADPARIRVECASNTDRIRMRVQDDGRGFDSQASSNGRMGLGIMAERAADIGANLQVSSTPGSGTEVLLEWLFPKDGDPDERR